MSRHTSDAAQRKSKRYQALHAQLAAECAPAPDKLERKRLASQTFRAQGDR